jgi:hypothetical protein
MYDSYDDIHTTTKPYPERRLNVTNKIFAVLKLWHMNNSSRKPARIQASVFRNGCGPAYLQSLLRSLYQSTLPHLRYNLSSFFSNQTIDLQTSKKKGVNLSVCIDTVLAIYTKSESNNQSTTQSNQPTHQSIYLSSKWHRLWQQSVYGSN